MKTDKKTLGSLALALTGLGLFILLLTHTGVSWVQLRDALGDLTPLPVLGCPLIVGAVALCSAVKWKLVTETQPGDRLGLGFYFRYIVLSVGLGQVLPLTLTNATVRAVALKRKAVMPVMRTAGLFLWDQGFDFLALLLLLAAGLAHLFRHIGGGATLALFAATTAVILLGMPLFTRAVTATAALLGRTRLLPGALRSRFAALSTANILAPALARRLFLLSVIKFLFGAAFYVCIVLAFGRLGLLDVAFWGAPTAEMAGVLSQMPGGIGALDWTWVGIFTGSGIDARSAVTLALVIRGALLSVNLFVAAAVWSVYLTCFKFRRRGASKSASGE